MPRTARPWEPNALYHADARAHSGAPIFGREEDRAFVVERAAKVFGETGVVCLGWSVLVNHYHMLLRCPTPPGHAFKRLNTAIARRVRRRGGQGAVFQGRYWAALCTDEASVHARLAYVVGNPVHHRVVPTIAALGSHPWSSLGEAIGRREAKLSNPDRTLALLHEDRDQAARTLVNLLESHARLWEGRGGDPDEDEPPEPTLALPRRLADPLDAPHSLRALAGPLPPAIADWENVHARRAMLRREGWTPESLVVVVCALTGADPVDVRAGRRMPPVSRARAIVAHIACDHLAWPIVEVAATVGASGPAVSQARSRGSAALAQLGVAAWDLVLRSRRGVS